MVSTTKARLTEKQRKALFSRARRGGTSLSGEVRKAIDLYLDLSPDFGYRPQAWLVKEMCASLDRSIATLDRAIACCWKTNEKRHEVNS